MLLRSTLEKTLPVHEGERRLWREEDARVFKGRYLGRRFKELTQEKAPDAPQATDRYGMALPTFRFLDVAIRTGMFGAEHRGRGGLFAPESTPYKNGDVLSEHKLRIQHVESVARRIKGGVAILAIGAVGIVGPPSLDSIPHPHIAVPFGAEDVGTLVDSAANVDLRPLE